MKVHGTKKPRVLSASTLKHDKVVNRQGEHIGQIDEIMVDLERGRVAYAVLSFGGFLGVGDKLFAIPWGVLELDTDRKEFILDMDKDRLKNAPGFDKNNWPDMTDPSWVDQINQFYGSPPDWRA